MRAAVSCYLRFIAWRMRETAGDKSSQSSSEGADGWESLRLMERRGHRLAAERHTYEPNKYLFLPTKSMTGIFLVRYH